MADAIWPLLEAGEFDNLQAFTPPDFDWSILHPVHKYTPLQVAVISGVTKSRESFRAHLEIAEWLLENGADAQQEAARSPYVRHLWKTADRTATQVELPYVGKSTISLVAHCRSLLKAEMDKKGIQKADWRQEISNLTEVLNLLRKVMSKGREKVPIDTSVVELWESILHDDETHDVTFKAAGGNITAHQFLLVKASPVLAAMLSSSMREGSQKCIDVTDTTNKGVTFFLELLYTGTSSADLDASVALEALDLAHRWQTQGIVTMVVCALKDMITDKNFASIAEVAALKDLRDLKAYCKTFASNSTTLQKQLKDGKLPKRVLEMLGKVAEAKPDVKKRRTF